MPYDVKRGFTDELESCRQTDNEQTQKYSLKSFLNLAAGY